MPAETELAWAAGFIDGEGTLSVVRDTNRNRLLPRVCAYNTNPFPLIKLQHLFGGKVREVRRKERNPKRKPSFVWEIQNASACRVAQALSAYLIVKKPHAELLARFQKTVNGGLGRTRSLRSDIVEERESIKRSFARLSKRGYALEGEGSPKIFQTN